MAKTTYTVKSELRHDGVDYVEGDPIELEPKQAKPLLALEVIAPANKQAPSKTE